jgi:hypothetical protein
MGSQQLTVHREAPVDLRSWFFDEPGPAWFVHAFRVCMVAVCLEEDRASHEMGLRCPAPRLQKGVNVGGCGRRWVITCLRVLFCRCVRSRG